MLKAMETNGEIPPTSETSLQLREIMQSIAYLEQHMTPLWHVYKHSNMHQAQVKQRHSSVDISKASQLRDRVVAQATNLIRFAASELSRPQPGNAQIVLHPSMREQLNQQPNFDELQWIVYEGKREPYALEVLHAQYNTQAIVNFFSPPLLAVTQFAIHGHHPERIEQTQMLTLVNDQAYIPHMYETELPSESLYRIEYHPAESEPEHLLAFRNTCRSIVDRERRR